MARNGVELQKVDTIVEELEKLQKTIGRRAYDLFCDRGTSWGNAAADWLSAEHELVWKPAIELRQRNGQFEVLAATPGVEAKQLSVEVTPDSLLIKAEIDHDHPPAKGSVHVCEFHRGRLFRSISFPEKIDPDSAKVDYRNGLLRVTAGIRKTVPAKVKVEMA